MYLEQRIKKRIEDRNLREPIKIFFKGIHLKRLTIKKIFLAETVKDGLEEEINRYSVFKKGFTLIKSNVRPQRKKKKRKQGQMETIIREHRRKGMAFL